MIKEVIKDKRLSYEIIQTTKIGEAKRIAQEAMNKEGSTIVEVGGDGTMNEFI